MNSPTTRPPRRRDGSGTATALTARRRRQRPAWLVVLALTVHLQVPGLCLAQMLSAAALGQICTTAPQDGRRAASPIPDERAGQHALEGCDQCVASSAALAPGASAASDLQPRAAAPSAPRAPVLAVSNTAWRPPPRGPPSAA